MARQTYEQWYQEVATIVGRKFGLSLDDLPDYCYADACERGDNPSKTARDAIVAAEVSAWA